MSRVVSSSYKCTVHWFFLPLKVAWDEIFHGTSVRIAD
eukprot:jgi/Botrbrau1/9441/Bobra.0252s0064.1